MPDSPNPSDVSVHPFTPDLLPDWLAFFDGDAFADNPDWAPCYCHFFHADSAEKPFENREGPENRAAACALLTAGRMHGYLAYIGGKPVGWCQAAPRLLIPNLQQDERKAMDDVEQVGAVVCFVIAKAYRRRGIATALLNAALAGFRREGLTIAEAYPRQHSTDDADNYHGPLSLYLGGGFSPVRDCDTFVIVRRDLATAYDITLRPVAESDLAVFFEHEQDEAARWMAAFTAKDPTDHAAFMAHWAKVLADPGITIRTILADDQIAGSVLVHGWFGEPEISYWIGRPFWGQGVASRALALFLAQVPTRPLYARVAKDNLASLRVLEKCGFTRYGEDRGSANARGAEVEELILVLS